MTHPGPEAGFASALSTRTPTAEALAEVIGSLHAQLGPSADLVVAFFSAEHLPECAEIARELGCQFGTGNVIGCSGQAIVGRSQEVETEPALSVWAARVPGVTVLPMHLEFARTADGDGLLGWHDDLPAKWPEGSALLLLGDPYTFPAEVLLDAVNAQHPGTPVIGGMASTASQPGENRLLLADRALDQGAVAVFVTGPIRVRTLVSQGCRPIGHPFVITRAERNIIQQLGGQPAYQRLVEVYQTLATREQEQVRRGLHIGRVVSEYLEQFEQGDFLVRNVMGVDSNSGSLAVGDYFRAGQTVQFHVRDWETADAELRQLLAKVRPTVGTGSRGGLLFTCNGRGNRLFPEPNHDALAVADAFPDLPLAGFFAAGELGPVGGRNFLHGFTASLAILEHAPNHNQL